MLSHRQLFFDNQAQTSVSPVALEIEKASGCWLFSPDGKKYFDLIAGVSVSNTGHNNPYVIDAVKKQLDDHMHIMVYGEYIQKPQVQLASFLCGLLPPGLDSVYYTNSGSESVEGALKLSRRYTQRYEIISFKNSYHGSTTGALSVTGNETLKRAFRPLLPSVKHIDLNNEDSLNMITNDTACVLIEPVQAEAGVILPERDFLVKLREKCTEQGTLLIFDEIQTGFGRTGKMFAIDYFGVNPDIVLFAKGFGGGMPLGAFVASKEIMSALSDNPALGHITTFGGHPVSCAAAFASLNYIVEHKLCEEAEKAGETFLQRLVHPAIKSVRGLGLLIALELDDAATARQVVQKCRSRGLLTEWFLFNEKSIRISPPLTISNDEVEMVCRLLLEIFDEI